MPAWIHKRAKHILAKNPGMPESEAWAISSQQAYASGKAPKGYGTSKGRKAAKKKYDKPKKEYDKNPTGNEKKASSFDNPLVVPALYGAGGAVGAHVLPRAFGFKTSGKLLSPLSLIGATLGVMMSPKSASLLKQAQEEEAELELEKLPPGTGKLLNPFIIRKLTENDGATSVVTALPEEGMLPVMALRTKETAIPWATTLSGLATAGLTSLALRKARLPAILSRLVIPGAAGGGAAALTGQFARRDPEVDISGGQVDPLTAVESPLILSDMDKVQQADLERLAELELAKLSGVPNRKTNWTKPKIPVQNDEGNVAGAVKATPPPPVT